MKWLPTLYKLTSVGADQSWDIGVDGSTIVTRWGQVGGRIQETRDEVKEGKNQGRANSTTPEEQALSEATSRWEKKVKKGYVRDIGAARKKLVDATLVKGGIFPMLAEKFSEFGDRLVYPCYVQPKLDGHRCIAMVDDRGACTLWTRSRKPITSMPHIVRAVESLGLKDAVLDGELYLHGLQDNFEQISSFVRDTEPKSGSESIEYHVYDFPHPDWEFDERCHRLSLLKLRKPLVFVETFLASNEEELMLAFERFLSLGYEGAMGRNSSGLYVNKRSKDLLKIKEFDDAEFVVVGVNEGRGKMAGHAIFSCRSDRPDKQGTIHLFEAKMKGPLEELRKYWEDPRLAVGKRLTVQYQGYTNKKFVPRFPVALRFRDE